MANIKLRLVLDVSDVSEQIETEISNNGIQGAEVDDSVYEIIETNVYPTNGFPGEYFIEFALARVSGKFVSNDQLAESVVGELAEGFEVYIPATIEEA